jgi:hypothetical protein
VNKEEMMVGRVAFMRDHGWYGGLYAQVMLLDVMDYNIDVLPSLLDSKDRAVWPEMRAMVDAADYDVNTWIGWNDIPPIPEPRSQMVGRVAFLRAHGKSFNMVDAIDNIEYMSQTFLISWLSRREAENSIAEAVAELDEWEHDRGDCPKLKFLSDPITIAYGYGVADEFVDKIKCHFCDPNTD